MSLTENSNQVFLPGGATNSQNSPHKSVWPLHYLLNSAFTNDLKRKEFFRKMFIVADLVSLNAL